MNRLRLDRGMQIIYVPNHAGDRTHPDCEIGFVTSVSHSGETVFCRYWDKHNPKLLRTKANSEGTPHDNLIISDSVPQMRVEEALKKYCREIGR